MIHGESIFSARRDKRRIAVWEDHRFPTKERREAPADPTLQAMVEQAESRRIRDRGSNAGGRRDRDVHLLKKQRVAFGALARMGCRRCHQGQKPTPAHLDRGRKWRAKSTSTRSSTAMAPPALL